MPPDDYSAVVSGGLKIKGVNPSSKVSKHKKKKPKPETDSAATEISQERAGEESTTGKGDADSTSTALTKKIGNGDDEEEALRGKEEALTLLSREGKTEAELRHEERRRKRLDERLKREGTKTHKERVEELNRYLSNLSEHHDMPRIGPG